MRTRLIFPILAICLCADVALALSEADCQFRDLRSKFPPIRDQGMHIGWCYAFTATDLLTEAADVPPTDAISPLDVGTTFVAASSEEVAKAAQDVAQVGSVDVTAEAPGLVDSFQGLAPTMRRSGLTEAAMALYLRQNRVCTESQAPTMNDPNPPKPVNFLGMWAASKDERPEAITFIERGINKRVNEFDRLNYQKGNSCLVTPTKTLTDRDSDIFDSINNYAAERLKLSLDKSCEGSAKINKEFQIKASDNKNTFIGDIKKLLDEKRPVGFGYDYCSLAKAKPKKSCGHASSIVGRQFDPKTKTCKLLVRNSHGANCKQYEDMSVECAKDSPGYYWIDQNKLNKIVFSYTWVEKDKKEFVEKTRKPRF